jgi:uncharacterized protein
MRRTDREITKVKEIESIIERADVCRIALTDGKIPYIVAMNFGYISDITSRLYFHCAEEGKKIDMIRNNNRVCFQMDTDHKLIKGEKACDYGMGYCSIVGWGSIHIVENEEEKKAGIDIIMRHYSMKKEFDYNNDIFSKTRLLRLEISEIHCKKR